MDSKRFGIVTFCVGLLISAGVVLFTIDRHRAVHAAVGNPASGTFDYPLKGSVFPPEITPPTFIWHDDAQAANLWRIDVVIADGSPKMRFTSRGEPLTVGEIDQRCISARNELPKLTPDQAAAHTWIPDANAWEKIKKHSSAKPAQVSGRHSGQ